MTYTISEKKYIDNVIPFTKKVKFKVKVKVYRLVCVGQDTFSIKLEVPVGKVSLS